MKIQKCTRILFANTALITALCAIPHTADGFIAGAKATGMASTGIAYPQDAFAGAYNPAGAVEVGDRFDLGFAWIRNQGHADIEVKRKPAIKELNGKFDAFDSPNLYLGDFGFNKNFRSNICGQNWDWSMGVVLYNRDYIKTTYSKPIRLLGTSKLGMEYIHEVISPLASLRLTENHTIGISIDVHMQRLKVNGLQQFSFRQFSVSPTDVSNRGYAYSTGIGGTFGWKWQAYDCLTLGVTYCTKVHMRKLSKYNGFLAQDGRIDSPERWGIGLAYQFLPCATFTFDFEWVNWQEVKVLHNPLLHKGNLKKLGSNDGPGFGFRNQLFYRFGLDYALDEFWTFRIGYRHANTVIRKTETAINLLTCESAKNYLTLGATYSWRSSEFTFFYAHGFANKIRGKDSIPTAFGKGEIDLTQSKNSLGISWGYSF